MPVTFDRYSIKGKDVFFQSADIYAINVNKITTTNGQVSVDGFLPETNHQFWRVHQKISEEKTVDCRND